MGDAFVDVLDVLLGEAAERLRLDLFDDFDDEASICRLVKAPHLPPVSPLFKADRAQMGMTCRVSVG